MRKVFAALSLAALVSTSATAQSWHTAIGVQGGFSRLKFAGTGQNDAQDLFDVPGGQFIFGGLSYGSLYVILPVADKIALEPAFGASQIDLAGQGINVMHLGLRADYAVTPNIYAALGGELLYVGTNGPGTSHSGPLGVTAAVGYRTALTGKLDARIEARVAASGKFNNTVGLRPIDSYSLLFGVSNAIGAGRTGARGGRMSDAMWTPALGVAGGYFNAQLVGGPAFAGFAAPGLGGSVAEQISSPLPSLPSFFAIIPVGNRLAIEPGFNLNRMQQLGGGFGTNTAAIVSARLDLAVTHVWYAGVGPVANYFKTSGFKGAAQLGVTVAWGARFHVAGDLGGRVETSYSMLAKHRILGVPPINILAVSAGMTMGL
ncbi:MAG TPA: hypothetical protein VI160_06260 [Gemmatimonadales bacterium]